MEAGRGRPKKHELIVTPSQRVELERIARQSRSARSAAFRARIILEYGETRAFKPFNREAMFEKSKSKSINELLDTFARLRADSLQQLDEMNLTPELLEKRGLHPELGPVTLSQLLATWVVHDLSHIGQIVRVMSKQYGDAVGPWKAYLPLLTR